MFPNVEPNNYSYPSVLKAIGGLGCVQNGMKIHTHVLKYGFGFDVVVASCLAGMYAKCGLFDLSMRAFDEMTKRDVPSWNTVMSCYYQSGKYEGALGLLKRRRVWGFNLIR
ncbi:hypothetical protein GIB67_039355 [Kingdonia uniflora]|uniref:Pentatricopeptide repeat-containing protein n=1 Tax=Kingdonia uniflora TaxID=39325 RepID=A0A7J7LX94_9MAGN|nr:hypothetical protein GIB67_039355 [Kingdonia uniflora]